MIYAIIAVILFTIGYFSYTVWQATEETKEEWDRNQKEIDEEDGG